MADKKKHDSAVIPSEVRELIQESQKIHGWVERLAEHSGEARPEVFDKVRADYDTRLQAVNGQLSQHRVQLAESLATRRAEVETLRHDRDEHQAELEEAKLRHAVGEYGDAEWKKQQETISESLDALDELLKGEQATVNELDDIIGSIGTAGPRLVVDEPASDATDLDVDEAQASSEAILEDAESAKDADVAVASIPEKLESGKAPTADPRAEASAQPTAASPSESTEEESDDGEYLDELEFLESLSLGDADRFDAVSAMLDEDDGGKGSD